MNILDNNLDYQILKMLQKDGRMSFTEMSNEINVAVSTIRHRFLNLIDDDTLKIVGRINPSKIGFNAYANIMISVKPKSYLDTIIETLVDLPEITFLASTSGEFDLEANIMCHSMESLNDFLSEKILTMDGIFDTKTNLYLKTYKYTQPDLELAKSMN